ncbi:hypothetical protein BC940DRAFT_289059 [Gongronella butleri]|nr:hypothetical protein BC940DRAFT_289059 [Gongronella butleri]
MTSAKEFSIEMLSVPIADLPDVLRALLHSIFFHRLLVNVTPRELHVLDTTVSMTDSDEIQQLIEDKVTEFMLTVQSQVKQAKLAVLFYEKRLKKNWFQFSKSEELVCWEQWTLTIGISYPDTDQEGQQAQHHCKRQLSQCLFAILKLANDHKEHIPSITTTDGNPFPYQVAIATNSESWSNMIKRLLVTDAPTSTPSASTTAPPLSLAAPSTIPAPLRSSSSVKPSTY